MTLTAAYEISQIAMFFATVVFVAVAWQQLKLLSGQARTAFEDSLTAQYRRIMKSIPTDVWMGLELNALDEEQRERCRDAIYRYIDLCNEQAFLHRKKRITPETWAEWSDGISSNMRLPAFVEVWDEVVRKCPKSFAELKSMRL